MLSASAARPASSGGVLALRILVLAPDSLHPLPPLKWPLLLAGLMVELQKSRNPTAQGTTPSV